MTAAWPPADHSAPGWPVADHTAAAWPVADDRLERGYRRLLLAYPRRHRHRHGTELVTTLLEMAAPGSAGPASATPCTWSPAACGYGSGCPPADRSWRSRRCSPR